MADQTTDTALGWEDVERAALHDPVLQAAVHHVRRGTLTREQALIAASLALAKIRRDLINDNASLLAVSPAGTQQAAEAYRDGVGARL